MLIQDLYNNTPRNHPDYEDLQRALVKMKEVAGYVNEKKREAENLNQVSHVQKFLVGKFEVRILEILFNIARIFANPIEDM